MATVGQSGALRRVTVHYANSPTHSTVAEVSLDDLNDELLQFFLADLLPGQEGLHQSFLDGAYINQNHMRGAGRNGPYEYDYSQSQEYHGESSSAAAATTSRNSAGTDEQIASDFEYAKQLQQEMEDLSIQDDDDISCVLSPSDSDDEHEHDHHDEEEEEADRQDGNGDDDVDPDNMTYEQRQALVESVGTEDRGLSDELISFLEPWKYKAVKASGSGFFSRKTNHEDCTICLSTFRSRETMITLPCRHHYHAACVTRWLKVNKTCPICKYELFGPS